MTVTSDSRQKPFHQQCALLLQLPWLTTAFLEHKELDLLPERSPNIQMLVRALHQFEDTLYKGPGMGTLGSSWYEKLLTSRSAFEVVKESGNRVASQAVANVLIYKLIDVVGWMKYEARIATDIPRGEVPTLKIIGMEKLGIHWHQFLVTASTLAHQQLAAAPAVVDSKLLDVTSRQMNSLCKRLATISCNKFLTNVQLAAMHVSYLMKGRLDFPDTFAELAHEIGVDATLLEVFSKRQGIQGMRLPLHMSLAISPCILFFDNFLHKQNVDRMRLLQVWQSLGSNRPESLLTIERLLWDAIFTIATGSEPVGCLTKTLSLVDNALKEVPDNEDFNWFASSDMLKSIQKHRPQILPAPSTPDSGNAQQVVTHPPMDKGLHDNAGEQDMDLAMPSPPHSPLPQLISQGGPTQGVPHSTLTMTRDDQPEDMAVDPKGTVPPSNTSGSSALTPATTVPTIPREADNAMDVDKQTIIHLSAPVASGATHNLRRAAVPTPPKPSAPETKLKKQSSVVILTPPKHTTPISKKKSESTPALGSMQNSIDLMRRCVDGKILQLVDLTDEQTVPSEPTLTDYCTNTPRFVGGRKVELFDAQGNVHKYEPRMHSKSDIKWFYGVHASVSRQYVDGRPLHIADPTISVLSVMTVESFDRMSCAQVQSTFSKKHIVVHGYQVTPCQFDIKALSALATPTFMVRDYSVKVEKKQLNQRTREATIRDLLGAHISPNGKILNALDFPLCLAPAPPRFLSSDRVAWLSSIKVDDSDDEFPTHSMKWGLAATGDAHHGLHVDCDGLGTYIEVRVGLKWWVMARPLDGADHSVFAYMEDVFNYVNEEGTKGQYAMEAVLLKPGTRLYMRPNTPHCVLTAEAAICQGGHFYASSTIRDSVYGFLNSFVASTLITNTEHTSHALLLMRRLIKYYHKVYVSGDSGTNLNPHVPNVNTFDGILDIFSICNVLEASNIVHYQTYVDGGLDGPERKGMITGRFYARCLLSWIMSNYQLEGDSSLREFYWRYLAHQMKTLHMTKQRVEPQGIRSFNGKAIAAQVKRNINRCFAGIEEFWRGWAQLPDTPHKLAWSIDERYQVYYMPTAEVIDLNFGRSEGYTSDDVEWAKPTPEGHAAVGSSAEMDIEVDESDRDGDKDEEDDEQRDADEDGDEDEEQWDDDEEEDGDGEGDDDKQGDDDEEGDHERWHARKQQKRS